MRYKNFAIYFEENNYILYKLNLRGSWEELGRYSTADEAKATAELILSRKRREVA